jgi:nitrogen PTS system EIIA component
MHLFMVRGAILPGPQFQATSREEAISEMVASLRKTSTITEADEKPIVEAILRREKLGTTGIGNTIAIPHSRHHSVQQLAGTLAVSPTGLNWDSVDGDPVYVMVLLVSPPDKPGDHLRALEHVVTRLRDTSFVQALRNAQTADEIWTLLGGSS